VWPAGLFKPCREAAAAALSAALPQYGFSADALALCNGVFRQWWIRDCRWKWDIVEIAYRRRGHLHVPVNLCVVLPLGNDAGTHPTVDARGIDTPTMPYFVPSLRIGRYGSRVARCVRANLGWFDALATPEQCTAALFDVTRNRPHGPAARLQMQSFLATLGEGTPNPSLQRTPPG
jgi:hypothetical protein